MAWVAAMLDRWGRAPDRGAQARSFPTARGRMRSWLAVTIFVVTALAALAFDPVLYGEVHSGLIFVLGITLIGATSGLRAALVSAMLASALFNFFLADPVLTFRMSTGQDLAPPAIFTACALASGLLAGRLRDETSRLGETNSQLETLLEISRALQSAPDLAAIEAALTKAGARYDGLVFAILGIGESAAPPLRGSEADRQSARLARRAIAQQAPVMEQDRFAYRLDGREACMGALVVRSTAVGQADVAFLEAVARLVGLALERTELASAIADAEAKARTEELKSALLSSVSHDVRTPLTAISASASSLIEFSGRLDDETSRRLLRRIVDECDRLNRFTANLLELSRLESGSAGLCGQVLSVNDLVRAVVKRLKAGQPDRVVEVVPDPQEMFVVADTAVFELALTNVVQNALLYSAAGTTVSIGIRAEHDDCVLTVTDEGCGIPPSEQARVFERFYRVKRPDTSAPGSGLGLSIAKGFVEAFGGSIGIISPARSGKGTEVTIRLPAVRGAPI